MRNIRYADIVENVKRICIESNISITNDLEQAYKKAIDDEKSAIPKAIMNDLYENAKIARQENIPICQDTGTAIVFLELGQDVHIEGGFINDAINEGVREGYKDGYLRKSIVEDPITRINTNDNTPAVIHIELVIGDVFKLTIAPKGGGSENMSRLKMLTPADGLEGFKNFILETVRLAGPNPCPPTIIGACMGGNFETCAYYAKKSLLRSIGERNKNKDIAKLEIDLLQEINKLNIGPQGFGGNTTAFDVHIEFAPCHIASLPVAVNLNCHVARHGTFIL